MAKYTHDAIMNTFTEMIHEMPFDKITVAELVRRCNISPNTFYYHYKDIYELLGDWLKEGVMQFSSNVDFRNWKEVIKRVLRMCKEHEIATYHIYNSLSRDALERFAFRQSEDIIRSGIEQMTSQYNANIPEDKITMISNTCKFMLDNLVDFDPITQMVKPADMPELDRWLNTKLNELMEKVEQAYNDYEFHIITHAVNDFCVGILSTFYLDIVKDRLYCDGADSLSRRSAQTALYLTLDTLTKLFAPILAFTCDEIWLAMPHKAGDDGRNVLFNDMNKPFADYALTGDLSRWETARSLRDTVNAALETARADKKIGKSLEAAVALTCPDPAALPDTDLADLFIVSQIEVKQGDTAVEVKAAQGVKCPRCWKFSASADAEGLCPRCAKVMSKLPELA